VRGERDGQPFETVAPMEKAQTGHGINVLWARRKIQSLLDGVHEGADPEAVRTEVVSLGLTHHLVTRHTSLVAVDVTPVRPVDESMESVMIPLNTPHGSVPGTLPQSATPANLFLLEGLVASITAAVLFALARRS
jgi:Ca-activated chloride channel homolog